MYRDELFSASSNETILPASTVEDTVAPLMKEHNIPVVHVYDALAAREDFHEGKGSPADCTHFGVDALLYMNEQVLKNIVSIISSD